MLRVYLYTTTVMSLGLLAFAAGWVRAWLLERR
jgi:hypothetical protein